MRRLLDLVVACVLPVGLSLGDEPPARYEVVTPKPDKIIATGINARGDVIGFEWVEERENPGVIGQEPFFARGGRQIRLPLLPTYTFTAPAGVSDDGLVVGRAGKPSSTRVLVPLQNQAFTWTEAEGIRGLGALPDDHASFATAVTRDGRSIAGISVGNDRIRPVVWDRSASGSGAGPAWRGVALPQTGPTASNFLALSDDGRYVAGIDNGTPTLWTRPGRPGDPWTGEPIGPPGSINPRAVNNAATVAGIIAPRDGSTHAVVWTRAGGVRPISEPPGYNRSEAGAINNAGSVVGMIDGPHGSNLAPRAFVFEKGQLRILEEGGPDFSAATAINDRGQVTGVFEKEEDDEPPKSAKLVPPRP